MPKLLIDGAALLSPLTGVGRYTYENAKRFDDKLWDVWYDYGTHSHILYDGTNDQSVVSPYTLKSLITRYPPIKKIARKIREQVAKVTERHYDLYWQPNFIPLSQVKADKIISTVHDFSFLLQPEWHPKERLDYFNTYFYKQVATSHHIVTGSYYTKLEILHYMDVREEDITVIYHGVDTMRYRRYDDETLRETAKTLALPKRFILFVGSIEPRKNLLTLLRAYNHLTKEEKEEMPLLLAGFKGWENTEIMHEIEKSKAYIRYLGYVNDDHLAHLYNLASLFVYPSLYEGFGIPPLEAMACGTPVIASNASSLPEVCGGNAYFIDPLDDIALSQQIKKFIDNNADMESFIQSGYNHAQSFSWNKAALKHQEIFEKILGK